MPTPCVKWPDGKGGYWGNIVGTNLGAGYGIYVTKVNNVLQFKSINTGIHTNINVTGNEIIISGEPGILKGTSFPSTPLEGQVFYRTDLKKLYTWTGTEWTWSGPFYAQDLNPADPEIGQIYYNTLQSEMFVWDGTSWDEILLLSNTNLIELQDVQSNYGTANQFLMTNGTDAVWEFMTTALLDDVDLSGLDNGDHLRWNNVTSQWETRASTFTELLDTPPVMGTQGQIVVSNGASLEYQGPNTGVLPNNGDLLMWSSINLKWQSMSLGSALATTVLDDLSDVNAPNPSNNDTIMWNGTSYVNSPIRTKLTNNLIYYVNSSTGNNTNDGLTPASPFLTIQHAVDVVVNTLDLSGWTVTINVANGAYNEDVSLKSVVGEGTVSIIGNQTTPTSVLVNGGFQCSGSSNANWEVRGFQIDATGSSYTASLEANNHATLVISDLELSSAPERHLYSWGNGRIVVGGNYVVSGQADVHMDARSQGTIIADNYTITLNNTLTFSDAFVVAENLSLVQATNMTFVVTGTVSGARYNARNLGMIDTQSASPTYFPGSAGGVTNVGGQYN